jgi:Ankyrin repeats (3 copies)
MRYVRAAVVALLAAGCTPSAASFTTLAGPAREGDLATMQRLIAAGANPNQTDPGGNHWTPLLHAIHKEQPAAVDLLIRSGADPKLATASGFSPLLMAVGSGNAAVVRRLLDAGADPRSDDRILLTAISGGALSDLDNPLLGRCNTEVVKALMQRAPDLRVRPDARGRIATLFARWNNCNDVLQSITRQGS